MFSVSSYSQPSKTMKYLNPWKVKGLAKNSMRRDDTYSAI